VPHCASHQQIGVTTGLLGSDMLSFFGAPSIDSVRNWRYRATLSGKHCVTQQPPMPNVIGYSLLGLPYRARSHWLRVAMLRPFWSI